MQLVSFDALRTLKLPDTTFIKPEHYLRHLPQIRAADWLLFPPCWLVNALVSGQQKRIFPGAAQP